MPTHLVVLLGFTLALIGCRKNTDSSSPDAHATAPAAGTSGRDAAGQSSTQPRTSPSGPTDSQAGSAKSPVPAGAANANLPGTSELAAALDGLTQALRKYSAEKQRVPASLNEVVTAGYLKNLPQAPVGKKFVINEKRVEVILVSQ